MSIFFHFLIFNCCIVNHSHRLCNTSAFTFRTKSTCNNDLKYSVLGSVKRLLLLLSGDIEVSPGPHSKTDLCVVHVNTGSIRNKTDLLEAEYRRVDVITVSETWLSDLDCDSSIYLTHFRPPVCRDRPNNPHGGVAIYVRNNMYYKPRIDLSVNGLEAVWVETKIRPNKFINWILLSATKLQCRLLEVDGRMH